MPQRSGVLCAACCLYRAPSFACAFPNRPIHPITDPDPDPPLPLPTLSSLHWHRPTPLDRLATASTKIKSQHYHNITRAGQFQFRRRQRQRTRAPPPPPTIILAGGAFLNDTSTFTSPLGTQKSRARNAVWSVLTGVFVGQIGCEVTMTWSWANVGSMSKGRRTRKVTRRLTPTLIPRVKGPLSTRWLHHRLRPELRRHPGTRTAPINK